MNRILLALIVLASFLGTGNEVFSVEPNTLTESEKKARQLADAAGIELVVLCPAMVIGPLDYRITPSTELILKMANFQLPYLMTYSGGTNLVDVRDVAFVHAKAVDAENVAGERFIIGSENVTSQQIGKLNSNLILKK